MPPRLIILGESVPIASTIGSIMTPKEKIGQGSFLLRSKGRE